MATAPDTTGAPTRAPAIPIHQLAQSVQSLGRRIFALAQGATLTLDEVSVPYNEPFTRAMAQRLSYADELIHIIGETVAQIEDIGEQIEKAGLQLPDERVA